MSLPGEPFSVFTTFFQPWYVWQDPNYGGGIQVLLMELYV